MAQKTYNEIFKAYDLHGYRLEEAIDFVEQLIGKIRLTGREETVKIITGRGVIRKELRKYLKTLDVDHRYELGNDGALILTIN